MTKGCYTCRRRRVVCDNGLPTCRKCRDAGKECLGYQKPLVWVKGGVASRGKMMGLTFEDVMGNNAKGGSGDKQPGTGSSKPSRCQQSSVPASTEDSSSAQDHPGRPEPQAAGGTGSHESLNSAAQPQSGTPADPPAADSNQGGSIVQVRTHNPDPNYVPTPWALVDPLFQDLDWLSRLYISHCRISLYPIMLPSVSHANRNPLRKLTDSASVTWHCTTMSETPTGTSYLSSVTRPL